MRIKTKIDARKLHRKVAASLTGMTSLSEATVRRQTDELYERSATQVPRDTDTLAASEYKELKVGIGLVRGKVGYGGNGDPVNPKTGQAASTYMVEVHEDLSMNHPRGGKAKFLEDPAREMQQEFRQAVIANVLKPIQKIFNKR